MKGDVKVDSLEELDLKGMQIRKIVTYTEEIFEDGGRKVDKPIRKSVAAGVIKNPYAGNHVEDLSLLIDWGEVLGKLLGRIAVSALGVKDKEKEVDNYGKGGIVGLKGEYEHVAAILHPKLGKPLREEAGGGPALIPSSQKYGAAGTPLDIPLGYKNAAFVRTHYDTVTFSIPDAPLDDELVIGVAVTNGGRPHPRIGGLTKEDAKGEDGLR
jgi:hypothetical protein